jgi:predicted nucleic acid-binding protein
VLASSPSDLASGSDPTGSGHAAPTPTAGPSALIDTGAMLALLDRDDAWHAACVRTFATLRLPLLTSAAVLAELFHLVGDRRRDVAAAWKFVRSGAVTVASIDDADLPALDALMARYHDRPMDFADATLVHLARRESLSAIFTIDHDDFETYRIEGRRRFRIVPERVVLRR